MKKILVPIDGSAESKKAAERAVSIAEKYGSQVTFLSVITRENELAFAEMGAVEKRYLTLEQEWMNLRIADAEKILDSMISSLHCEGIEIIKKIVEGIPHPEIISTAKKGDFELIVMGHRGLNTFQRIFLGSVAKRVIEDAPCSVLIVK